MSEVFISYCWKNAAHKDKVLSFTNFLRQRGYDASIDRLLSQHETATDFFVMMYKEIVNHKKVIIVLSEEYKKKADSFHGGVGTEYKLILKDIDQNTRKYILLSFQGIQDEIIPLGFRGREIIDISIEENLELLDYKLTDTPLYEFSQVAPQKPQVIPKKISPFVIEGKKLQQNNNVILATPPLENISSKVDLVKLIGEFVDLKQRDTDYIGLCPFHQEKTPSFSVDPSKNIYKCFGCHKAGNAAAFIMEYKNLSYPETIKWFEKNDLIKKPDQINSVTVKENNQPIQEKANKAVGIFSDRKNLLKFNFLDDLEEAIEHERIKQSLPKIHLTSSEIKSIFDDFKKGVNEKTNSILFSQIKLMEVEIQSEDAICIFSPSELTNMYAREIRYQLMDFYKTKIDTPLRIFTEVREI